ncbi:MAG: hypothetical protein EAZ97_06235 [Bacteroidetes bacterium]|nr:MAG: hypothetical protein EAZ97_06235 [Bacteroidota bacterium]
MIIRTPYQSGVLSDFEEQKSIDSFVDLLKEIDLARDFEYSKSWRIEISSLLSIDFIKKNLPEQKLAFAITDLFGTADPNKIKILLQNFQPTYSFLQKNNLNPAHAFLWHQTVCLFANQVFLKPFDWNCEKELLEALKKEVRRMSFLQKMKNILDNYGIKLICVNKKNLRIPIDNSTFWLDQNPVIALSLRKKTGSDVVSSIFQALEYLFLHLKNNSKAIFINENTVANFSEKIG